MALDLVLAATGVEEPPTVWLAHSSLMLPSDSSLSLSVPDGDLRELRRWAGNLSFQQGGSLGLLLFLETSVHLFFSSVDDILEAEEDSCASSWRGSAVLDGGTQDTSCASSWWALSGVKGASLSEAELDDFGGSDVELCFVVVATVSWALALHLCLLFIFFFQGWFTIFTFSGAGQKKLTEKPPQVDLAVHCASLSFRQLCWSWTPSDTFVPFARGHTLASSATKRRQGDHNLHEENAQGRSKQQQGIHRKN